MTWSMPHEGDPHERTWMAWPSTGYSLGDSAAEADEARTTWAAVAHAVAEFEPVVMVVDPTAVAVARQWLGSGIELLEAPLDDAWMRDTGPTFVRDGGRLGAVDWVFNGWGAQDWATWDNDRHIGRIVAEAAGAEYVGSDLVQEGGAIHVDGDGTVLATRTVQLDPFRNPDAGPEDVEAELARTLGASTTIWLPRGLTRDAERFGTRGHVDMVTTFAQPGVALVHAQLDPAHPDAEVMRGVEAVLREARDAQGRTLDLVSLPAPERLRDDVGWVDHNYVNHLLVNGGVIACAFDDPADDRAVGILEEVYDGRTVVTVDARPLFSRGGGIHCITQQQPSVR